MWPPFFAPHHICPQRFLNNLLVAPAKAGAYGVSRYWLTPLAPRRMIGTSLRWSGGGISKPSVSDISQNQDPQRLPDMPVAPAHPRPKIFFV